MLINEAEFCGNTRNLKITANSTSYILMQYLVMLHLKENKHAKKRDFKLFNIIDLEDIDILDVVLQQQRTFTLTK